MTLKTVRITKHALEQCQERGASEEEVIEAIRSGEKEEAKQGRMLSKMNFQYNELSSGTV